MTGAEWADDCMVRNVSPEVAALIPEEGRDALRDAVRRWLDQVAIVQEAQNELSRLESLIRDLTDVDAGGPCDVCWPLVYRNVALEWRDGRLTMKPVERLA